MGRRAGCSLARRARPSGSPPRRAGGRAAAAPGRSYARRRGWSNSPTAASAWRSRSQCACAATRSATGSSRSPTPRRGRSARASSASRTSSATWPRSARSQRTHGPGPAALCRRPPPLPGSPGENTLLPDTAAELERNGLRPREVALDGGFGHLKSEQQLAPIGPDRVFVAGRQEGGSKRTRRRLRRYRTGSEGRISHLKRRYGLRRSRLKGAEGQRTWTGWAILAYNLDTIAIRPG